jgi:hypothetical protein
MARKAGNIPFDWYGKSAEVHSPAMGLQDPEAQFIQAFPGKPFGKNLRGEGDLLLYRD